MSPPQSSNTRLSEHEYTTVARKPILDPARRMGAARIVPLVFCVCQFDNPRLRVVEVCVPSVHDGALGVSVPSVESTKDEGEPLASRAVRITVHEGSRDAHTTWNSHSQPSRRRGLSLTGEAKKNIQSLPRSADYGRDDTKKAQASGLHPHLPAAKRPASSPVKERAR